MEVSQSGRRLNFSWKLCQINTLHLSLTGNLINTQLPVSGCPWQAAARVLGCQCRGWRWLESGNKRQATGRLIQLFTQLHLINGWKEKDVQKDWFEPLLWSNKHIGWCIKDESILILLCVWESFYQKKRACLERIVSVPFELHFLCLSVQFPPRRMKGSSSPPFIHPSDCRMDRSQLIRRWQEALLLAHWTASTKDRSHERNRHCPQIDSETIFKPGRDADSNLQFLITVTLESDPSLRGINWPRAANPDTTLFQYIWAELLRSCADMQYSNTDWSTAVMWRRTHTHRCKSP